MKLPQLMKNILLFLSVVVIFCGYIHLAHSQEISNYGIASQSDFNNPKHYPLRQSLNPQLYRPISPWLGRLILPSLEQRTKDSDWVFLEVYHAPEAYQNLVGQEVRLQWSKTPEVQKYVQSVTRDVNFTSQTQKSIQSGIVHPKRLDRRKQVGPLESLAGARSADDVIVAFQPTWVNQTAEETWLEIAEEPTQVTGRFYALVKILRHLATESFEVQHYNPNSGKFDGVKEVIRIPQVLPNRNGIYQSTNTQLETSPVGEDGWYIYGAANGESVFVVQAIEPRQLLNLQPDQVIQDNNSGLRYLNRKQWQHNPKGQLKTVLLAGKIESANLPLDLWQEGDRGLVMHLFGGIGGEKAETQPIPATVSGHFAYGIAKVVREPLTQQLRFQIEYNQVYAHNTDGIVAGKMDWSAYMGDRQRGWLGLRPVGDIIIKLDSMTQDYNFGGIILSPLQQLQQELEIMMARYRLGDGTGAAIVTPAKSCVQDANQALYNTIQHLKNQVTTTPEIQTWLRQHPQHPQTQRFQKLVQLGQNLAQELAPLGIVRSDWQHNADFLAGIGSHRDFVNQEDWLAQILSWRTLLPRYAQDRLARIFWQHRAQLWLLHTYQVGGWDREIAPLAPTSLLGRFPLLSRLLFRILGALATVPYASGWNFSLLVWLIYATLALLLGFKSGFLAWHFPLSQMSFVSIATTIACSFWLPAFAEELVFRVVLLPHPTEGVPLLHWWFWGAVGLVLFVVYHPLNASTFYRQAHSTFYNPIFLLLAGLLGLACTLIYWRTGSILPGLLLHWLVVVVWRLCLGGEQKLHLQ